MNAQKQEIGWRPFWFLIRGYQVLAVFIGIFLWLTRPAPSPQQFFMILGVAALVLLVFDMFARGTGSERGITFQRYFQEEFVPWRDIEDVTWSPKSVRIKLRGRHWLRRYVQFPLYSGVAKGFKFAFGGDVPEPDFVEWVRANGYLSDAKIHRHNRWTW